MNAGERECRAACTALLLLFGIGNVCLLAADDVRDKMNARFDEDIARLTTQIEKAPKSVDLYSQRGDAFFFRAKFADAVADYG